MMPLQLVPYNDVGTFGSIVDMFGFRIPEFESEASSPALRVPTGQRDPESRRQEGIFRLVCQVIDCSVWDSLA